MNEAQKGKPGRAGSRSTGGGRGGAGGEGGKGGEGRVGKPGGPGGRGGTGGDSGNQCIPNSMPVVVTAIAPSVDYKPTLRYIAVMMSIIVIILICEGIASWK